MKVLVRHIWLLLLLLNQKNGNLASGQCSAPTVLCCPGTNSQCYRGCYCDEYCLTTGDCCPDYSQTCSQPNSQHSSPFLSTTILPSTSIQPDAESQISPTLSSDSEPSSPSLSTLSQTSPTSSSITSSSANSESSSQSPPSPSTTLQSTPSIVPSSSSPSPTSQTSSSSVTLSSAKSEHSSPSPLSLSTIPSSSSSPPTTSSAWTTPHSPNLGLSLSPSSPSPTSAPSSSSTSPSSSITSSSVCNTCTENEVCQERSGVYGCSCLQGQRPNPEIFDAVESCSSSTGSMSLSRCQLFESGFRPENLHLSDPSCRGTLENGRLVFHFDSEDHICGTTLMSNRTHFYYQNSIQRTPRNTDQSVITRERWINITFSCAYPLIQTLSMPMGIQAEGGVVSAELPAGQGTYQIRMIPYPNADFTTPYDGEVQVQVNQQMYVAVEVEGVDRNQIATVLDNCWATPVNDFDYHIRWNLIIGECSNPEDGTVEVLQNGNDTKSHFSFRMFTFSGISDHVFLHCQVHLCLVQNGRCALSCDHGYRRRRRRSLDFHHSAAITMGLMKGLSNPDK